MLLNLVAGNECQLHELQMQSELQGLNAIWT